MQMCLSHGRLMDGISFPLNNLLILNMTVHLPQCEYKANKVRMEIMNHWFHHLQADSSWKPNAFSVDSDWSFLTQSVYMQWKEILFKSKPSKKQISLSKISCDRKVEVALSIFFFYTYLWKDWSAFEWKIKGDLRFNNWIVHWASWIFFMFRWVNRKCVSAQQKGVSFLSASSHSRNKMLSTFLITY